MGSFSIDGQRLAYTEYGKGPRLTVLLHGLLFSQRMHETLARALAERGHRVVTLDLLGHGESDRPREKWRYSMPTFGAQVIALLDELDAREATLLGTSLGANVALEAAVAGPGARARDGDRDAGARPRADRLRDRLHADHGRADRGRAGDARAGSSDRADSATRAPVAARHPARLGAPGPRAERRRLPGPVLRPHRPAARAAPDDRRADARDRPPARHHPSVLRRRDARGRTAQRPAAAGAARCSSCGSPRGASPTRSVPSWTDVGAPKRLAGARGRPEHSL